jgi:hypothetical protein
VPGPKSDTESGPAPELLIGPGYRVPNQSWAVARDEIFFVDRALNLRSATIPAYHLTTKRTRQILVSGFFSMNPEALPLIIGAMGGSHEPPSREGCDRAVALAGLTLAAVLARRQVR